MPPEMFDGSLVALDFEFDSDEQLIGRGERIPPHSADDLPSQEPREISWYYLGPTSGMRAVCGGLAYVGERGGESSEILTQPPRAGRRYRFKNIPNKKGVMFAVVLPTGYTLGDPDPMPVEAKLFQNRVAVYWMLNQDSDYVAWWLLRELKDGTDTEVQRINKFIWDARRGPQTPKYDVALSYASEDNPYVEQVAAALKEKGVTVFYDRDLEQFAQALGKDLYSYLTDVYRNQARYTLVFVSRHYAVKRWPTVEMEAAQERALQENREYILPAKFDQTALPGLSASIAYADLETVLPGQLAEAVRTKLQAIRI